MTPPRISGPAIGTTAGTVLSPNVVNAKGDLIAGTAADTVARLPVGTDGQRLVADSSQTAGLRWTRNFPSSELLTAGGEVCPARVNVVSAGGSGSSGGLWFTYFTAQRSETINTLTAYVGATAAGATPTVCRMGVYSVDGAGDLTLVASTPNDTVLFNVANVAHPKALSAPWSKTAGQVYAAGILVVSAAAMPVFYCYLVNSSTGFNGLLRADPYVNGRITGQTDLPGTIAAGTIAGYNGAPAILMS